MKHFLFIACIFVSVFTFAQSHDMQQLIESEKLRAIFQQNLLKTEQTATATADYDVKYYRMELQVNPAVNYIHGKITTYFVPTASNFQQIVFDIANVLTIDSAKYQGLSLTHSALTNNQHQFNFPTNLATNNLDSISVWYHGAPVATGFESFKVTTHNGAPVIWTMSCPYGAKDWWVCKQTLSDKADSVEMIVRTTAPNKVAANGKLLGNWVEGTNNVYHWKHRYPIATYLIAFATTNYEVYSDYLVNGQDSLEVENYVYPESLVTAQASTPNVLPVLAFFENKFGAYPFRDEQYGQAQFGWGGGMEHQTMSFVTDFNRSLLAHELSHQWFGDKVTCPSWSEVFLNEGFATYCAALVDEQFSSPTIWQNWKTATINYITAVPSGSAYCPDTTNINRIFDWRFTYQKGAMILHGLRWKLGDSLFFQGIRNYLADNSNAYQFGSVAKLKGHWEAISGQNLNEHFADWFYGEGYPNYQIRWNQEASGKVILKLNQTPSHASVSFFEMPIPIRLSGAGGLDTIVVLDHTFSGQLEEIIPNFTVTSVQFDPQKWILAKSSVVHDLALSVEQVLKSPILLRPNPSTNIVNISTSDYGFKTVQIYDMQGALLFETDINGASVNVDISTYPRGTYLVKIYGGRENYEGKLVKE
ncbi:MAG: M1 family aminopeptidase [Bacteroidia bacterium]